MLGVFAGHRGGDCRGVPVVCAGEITELSKLIYEARHNALSRIAAEAEACGADDVVGIKCHVYQLGGGMIEFLAIGTAVKKMQGVGTTNTMLPGAGDYSG